MLVGPAVPAEVVEHDRSTRRDPVPEEFERADFRLGVIEIQVEIGDLFRRVFARTAGTRPFITWALGKLENRALTCANKSRP